MLLGVDPFNERYISAHILSRLLNVDIYKEFEFDEDDAKAGKVTYIYEYGKSVDYFVLIVNGKAELETGKEKIVSDIGSFSYFGVSALIVSEEIPFHKHVYSHEFLRGLMRKLKTSFDRNRINFAHLFRILVYV